MTDVRTRATLGILAFSIIWGVAYVWMKDALDAAGRHLPEDSVALVVAVYLAVRFGLGALLLALCVPAARRRLPPGAWRGGAVLGGLLLVGFWLQLLGLFGIDPAVSAFLTSLYVVFTALLSQVHARTRPDAVLLLGVLMATGGAAWIGGPPRITFDTAEWLTVVGALVFAVHILATDRITRRVPALPITVTSLVWVAVGAGIAVPILVARGPATASMVWSLVVDPAFVVPVALAGTLASAMALLIMNRFQRELPPVRAAILYAMEPVWAALVAVTLGRAEPSGWLWMGGLLLFFGNLLVEVLPRKESRA